MPNDLIIEFYSGAITSLSAWWFKNERKVSAAEMDMYLHQLINGIFFSLKRNKTAPFQSCNQIDHQIGI